MPSYPKKHMANAVRHLSYRDKNVKRSLVEESKIDTDPDSIPTGAVMKISSDSWNRGRITEKNEFLSNEEGFHVASL
jgi:hypothetical protein